MTRNDPDLPQSPQLRRILALLDREPEIPEGNIVAAVAHAALTPTERKVVIERLQGISALREREAHAISLLDDPQEFSWIQAAFLRKLQEERT
jgi:hypothetical protein